jgi:uncharacterized protein YjiS (DUF1127 family)
MKSFVKWSVLLVLAVALVGLAGFSQAAERPLLWWDLQHPGGYINGYNDPDRDIWEIRNDAELLRRRLGRPKRLALRCAAFPADTHCAVSSLTLLRQARAWLQRPDGRLEEVDLFAGPEAVTAEVPEEGAPEGVYLLGGHLAPGRLDMDGDGRTEEVHLYGKFLLRHVRESLSHGGEQNVFFHSPRMPLEIGPVRAGRYSGIIQIAHRPCEMAVYYRGRPLAGAEVTILTERGWRKTVRSDANGRFVAVPHETRGAKRNWESYLYVVEHHDRRRGEYHCASMPMLVDPPWPEWTHCMTSFVLWSIAGTAFAVLLVAVLVWRRRRRSRLRLARLAAEKRPGGAPCA